MNPSEIICRVKALYKYDSNDPSSLSFRAGAIIEVLTQLDSGWWDGWCEGKRGWFPSNYVEVLKEDRAEVFDDNLWEVQQDWRYKHSVQKPLGGRQRVTDQDMQRQLRLSLQASDILERQQQQQQQRQQESPPSSSSSSSPWILQTTEDGSEQYYYNTQTQEMRYSIPPDLYMDDRDVNALAVADSPHTLDDSLYNNGTQLTTATPTMYENVQQPVRPVRAPNRNITDESPFYSNSSIHILQSSSDLRKGTTQQELSLKEELEQDFVDDERLPPNWVRKMTPKGRFYYCNIKTDETTWELEKIDPDTGILLPSSPTSAAHNGVSYSPKQSDFHGKQSLGVEDITDYMHQMYLEDDNQVIMTWQGLSTAIAQAIQNLKESIRQSQSQNFNEDTNTIVHRIRLLLHASDCVEKEASVHLKSNRQLRALHRSLLASLAKLVLSTKVASNAWPTPESLIKLQTDGEELLIAVRNFMSCAQELHLVIKEGKPILTYEEQNTWHQQTFATKYTRGYSEMDKSDIITSTQVLADNVRGAIGSYMESIRTAFEQPTTKAILTKLKANAPLLIAQFRNLSNTTSNFLNATEEACHHTAQATHNHEKYKRLLKAKQPIYKAMGSLFIVSQAITNASITSGQIKQSYEQIQEHVHIIDKGLNNMTDAAEKYLMEQSLMEARNTPTPTQRHYTNHSEPSAAEEEHESHNAPIDNLKRSDIGLNLLMNSFMGNPNGPLLDNNDDLPSDTSSSHHSDMTATNTRQQGKPTTNKYPSTEDPISRRRDTLIGAPTASLINGSSATVATNGSGGSGGHTPTSATTPSTNSNETTYWFLKTDYDPNEMIINTEGNVKGGSLHCLVQHLTQHDQLDSKFNTTFLLTYRSFCTTEELFHELFSRYQLAPPDGLTAEEIEVWKEKKLKLVRLRVFNVIKSWLETYFNEEEDRPILPEISHFTDHVIVESMKFGAEQLTKLIKKRMLSEDSSQIRKMKLNVRTGDLPVPILPKNMKRIKLLELDPHELARQMTIMDFRLYSKIKPVECLDKNWGKPDTTLGHGGHHIAANVKASIEHSNQVTAWVTDSILSKEEVKKRANVLKHWIFVAERCRFLNNYNTCMAILSAFDNGSIGRLKRTWELISTRTMLILQNIRRLMGANRNFSEYRDIIHRINPPCIPFLGIYLQDLTFIEDGNSNFLKKSNNLINFAKRMKTAEVIRDLQQYQSTHYMLTPVPDIQEFIKTHLHSSREEEELYNLSLKLEPRERGEDTIARRLKESGLH